LNSAKVKIKIVDFAVYLRKLYFMNLFKNTIESVSEKFLRGVRQAMSGRGADYTFRRVNSQMSSGIAETSVYVHIPFCLSLCPYCPYNRIPYEKDASNRYMKALKKEIESYSERFGSKKISSVYFGGGTPLLAGKNIYEIVKTLKERFDITGDFCIEANPNDITDESIALLKESGFSSISIGAQSFDDNLLKSIGRKYTAKEAEKAIDKVMKAGFDSVNIDILFALPQETKSQLKYDIEKALSLGTSQITTYPLFTFPYSEISNFKRIKRVKSPSVMKRRNMYFQIYDSLENGGYERCSVWSFKKGKEAKRYSSVTRERYIGFGASSGSYYETHFDLNTFSVEEYIRSVGKKGNAVALRVNFTKKMSKLYDFYWRLYDTYFPMKRNLAYSSYSINTDKDFTFYMKVLLYLRWAEREKDGFSLTREGSLWVHFLQNLMSLRAISIVWGEAKKNPRPDKIEF
jgi:oxygen-independent coproporphyrinogen-3 oxidase